MFVAYIEIEYLPTKIDREINNRHRENLIGFKREYRRICYVGSIIAGSDF